MLYNSENLGHQVLLASIIESILLEEEFYCIGYKNEKRLNRDNHSFSTFLSFITPFDPVKKIIPLGHGHVILASLYVQVSIGRNKIMQYAVCEDIIEYQGIEIEDIKNNIHDSINKMKANAPLIRKCLCLVCKSDCYRLSDDNYCNMHRNLKK